MKSGVFEIMLFVFKNSLLISDIFYSYSKSHYLYSKWYYLY